MKRAFTLLLMLVLTGCASAPKVAENADRSIAPALAAVSHVDTDGKPLQWGGVVVESRNLAKVTELQILAYPLREDGRPEVAASPIGRFIAQHPGYLESVDYRPGRQVTATGKLTEKRQGKVGDAAYTFPVLLADELVLWPQQEPRQASPRINFGLGVGSGGRSWGGVGIGIGF